MNYKTLFYALKCSATSLLIVVFPNVTNSYEGVLLDGVYQSFDFLAEGGETTRAAPVEEPTPQPPPAPAPRQDGIVDASALIAVPDDLSRQIECLALNIYWETKGEPLLGQVAVAAVTLNRVMDRQFPATVCEVVRQGGEERLHHCHFSWWCDGKDDTPTEIRAWRRALSLATAALFTGLPDPTKGALWFHADYVDPYWAPYKKEVARIGRHIFYVRPSQRPATLTAGL
jgi:hypothetical protein